MGDTSKVSAFGFEHCMASSEGLFDHAIVPEDGDVIDIVCIPREAGCSSQHHSPSSSLVADNNHFLCICPCSACEPLLVVSLYRCFSLYCSRRLIVASLCVW